METERRQRTIKKVTLTGSLVNCLLAGSQILFGIIGHSQALLADGFHTLSDLLSDFIILFAVSESSRAADEDHPYGHGRIETLATVLLGFLLIGAGLGIGYRGIASILLAKQSNPELITLFFAALAIIAKESLYRYTMRAAKRIHSSLLESNAWHHRSDALSSVVVVAGISTQLLGVPYMDAVVAIVVGIMILAMGFQLSRKALYELIDTGLDADLVRRIMASMESSECVEAVHRLRSRSMGGLGYVDAEILVDPHLTVSEAHHIAYQLEQSIKQQFPQIIDVQIHVDPLSESGHDSVIDLPGRDQVEKDLEQIWQALSHRHQIAQIRLHYLSRAIEIDLVFPLASNNQEHHIEVGQLKSLAQQISYVGKVNIYYTA